MTTKDRRLTPKEAAARAEVSVSTIRAYLRKGALRPITRGLGPRPRILVLESDLEQLFRFKHSQ